MTPLCCNDANVDHCSKNFFYATPTCRNDFWQSVAEIVVIYMYMGAAILDLATGPFLSRCLPEYGN